MGTRSRIGYQLKNGIVSSYHHWDGYPEWLGKTLVQHYNTAEKVTALIDGGDMSSCWSNSIWGEDLPEGEYSPEYYTARGEDMNDVAPQLAESFTEYMEQCSNCNAEYAYIFNDGEWFCYDSYETPGKVVDIPEPTPV